MVALFACNLATVGAAGRARAKEAVCLSNLRQLTRAWLLYADENDGKIINGEVDYNNAAPGTCTTPSSGRHAKEKWWVGTDTNPSYMAGVTLIAGLALGREGLERLARELKQKCGAGGTVKGGTIEIQGDHRDLLVEELRKRGYTVKRAGG